MNVFTYGTLMFPEVIETLTEKKFSFEDLSVTGFERRTVKGKSYPGICEKPNSSLQGRLWFEIDDDSLEMLDYFEDTFYKHRTLLVHSLSRGPVEARAYVVPPSAEHFLSREPWDEINFQKVLLPDYLQRCRSYRLKFLAEKSQH